MIDTFDTYHPLLAIARLGVAFGFLMMRVGVLSGHTALFLATPFIGVLCIASCREVGGFISD